MSDESKAPSESTKEEVTVGIPDRVKPENVARRKAALIAQGVDPIYAEKFAIDAEQAQFERDKTEKEREEKAKKVAADAKKGGTK